MDYGKLDSDHLDESSTSMREQFQAARERWDYRNSDMHVAEALQAVSMFLEILAKTDVMGVIE